MIDEIINNLNYINEKEKKDLKKILESNIDTNEYLVNAYNRIMIEWKKKYDCFDIPSCIVSISVDGKNNYYSLGEKKYTKDNIFDIASMSKLYTEIILFNVLDEYNLSIDTKVCDITNYYSEFGHLTFKDILSFNHSFLTKVDIRVCTNYEDGLKALRSAYLDMESEGKYFYSDLPIMIITDLMSIFTNMSYSELFDKYIVKKYDLNNTYLLIDDPLYITVNKCYVNDPKANIFGGYYGHAGVKTNSEDFIKFLNISINNKYLELFLTRNNAYRKIDGTKANNVGSIGNINLPLKDKYSIASSYLTDIGFCIQGSTRCHAEVCRVNIENKNHTIAFSLFMDLYTQIKNVKKYEEKYDKIMSREYTVLDNHKLIMIDVRKLLDYKVEGSLFKELINEISKIKYNELKKVLK